MRRADFRNLFPATIFIVLGAVLAINSAYLFAQRKTVEENGLALQKTLKSGRGLDTAQLEKLLLLETAHPGSQSLAAIQRTFNAFESNLRAWQIKPLIPNAPEGGFIQKQVATVTIRAAEARKLIPQLDTTDRVEAALAAVQEIDTLVRQVRQMGANRFSAIYEASKSDLEFRQTVQFVLVAAFLIAAVSWVLLLYRRIAALTTENQHTEIQAAQKAAQLKLDPATGLMTQSALNGKLRDLQQSLPGEQAVTILAIDVVIPWTGNGSSNRQVADTILCAVADRLQNLISFNLKTGFLARSGNHGFLVAMVHEPGASIPPDEFASRIRAQILRPVAVKSGTYPVTSVVGLAPLDRAERDPGVALQNAQLALDGEIRTGRRKIGSYQPSDRAAAERAAGIEQALLQALENQECLPHFQPQFDLTNGKIIAVEALARWYHPSLGWIAPAEVIPIAENNGLIVPLERKIVETACAQVQLMPESVDLAVNLSVAHILNDDVPSMIEECLSRSNLPASRLKLEISANTLPNALIEIRQQLDSLKDLGARLSLDNFGNTTAPLSGVLQYRWDEVKIDASLVKFAGNHQTGEALLAMALEAGNSIGAAPLVEGIESLDQRDMLINLGCHAGQGYLFGGPMAIDDLKSLFFSDQPNIARLLF